MMPIRAFTFPIPAFTMRARSRCADLGVHDRAKSANSASDPAVAPLPQATIGMAMASDAMRRR